MMMSRFNKAKNSLATCSRATTNSRQGQGVMKDSLEFNVRCALTETLIGRRRDTNDCVAAFFCVNLKRFGDYLWIRLVLALDFEQNFVPTSQDRNWPVTSNRDLLNRLKNLLPE